MKKSITYYYLPLFCEIATIFNVVFVKYGISRLYFIVYIIAVISLLLDTKKKPRHYHFGWIFIIFTIILTLLYSAFSTIPPSTLLLGCGAYILPLIYWLLYFRSGEGEFIKILFDLRYFVLVVAVLGFLQYFFSPTLWGFYDPTVSNSMITWSADASFESYSLFFRSQSILPSVQYLGMFMGLYLCLFYMISNNNKVRNFLLLAYVISGILSGAKSFYLIVIVFVFYNSFLYKKKYAKKLTISFIMLFGVLFYLSQRFEELKIFGRIFDIVTIAEEESGEGSRMYTYNRVWEESSFFGNGSGVIQNIEGNNLFGFVAESYIFQMIYELGYFITFVFLFFLFSRYLCATKDNKIMIFILLISMIIVHCFNGFLFFIFWGILLYPKSISKTKYPEILNSK